MGRKPKENLFYENLSGAELDETKKKLCAMRDQAIKVLKEENPKFLATYDKVCSGQDWLIKDIVNDVKRKGWSDEKYKLFFSCYALEKLAGENMKNSYTLAILMLAHEPLINYVMRKISIPLWISYDDVRAEMSYALRKSIDGYNVFGDVKFVSYACVGLYNNAIKYIDQESKRQNVSFEEVLEEKSNQHRTKKVDLRATDPFIDDYAEIDAKKRVWELLGHFEKRAQFIAMAVLNGVPRRDITNVVKMSKSSVNSIFASVMTEVTHIANDSNYIKDKKYKDFRYNECRSYVSPKYHLLSKEEYNSILEQSLQEKTM